MSSRTLLVPPRDPQAEPICLLTREWAARRAESPAAFLSIVTSETRTDRGIEYRIPQAPGAWNRIEAFVQEEGECCPFLAFEAQEHVREICLSIIWPEASGG